MFRAEEFVRKIVEIKPDYSNDEMRYSVTEENGQVHEVRIQIAGKAQAKPSPEAKIEEWLNSHPARAGLIRIPGDYFQSF